MLIFFLAGSYQVRPCGCERDDSNLEWQTGDGNVAGRLVLGV